MEKNRVFGKLCQEANDAYKHKYYFASLACLFVISEQIIKHSINQIDGNFYEATIEAREQNLLTEEEFGLINSIRKLRNIIFHENHYSAGIEIDKLYYPFDEDETKIILYRKYANKLFSIVLRLA